MIPPLWRPPLVVLGAVLALALAVGRCAPEPGPVRDWRQAAEAAEAESQRLSSVVAGLQQQAAGAVAEADRAQARAQAAQRRVARAEGQVAQLKAQVAVAQTAEDSVPVLVAVVAAQDTQIVALTETVGTLTTETVALRGALRVSEAVGDTLWADRERLRAQLRVGLLVTPKPCRILWMGCPSRTVMFVAGAVAGVGATVAVARGGI